MTTTEDTPATAQQEPTTIVAPAETLQEPTTIAPPAETQQEPDTSAAPAETQQEPIPLTAPVKILQEATSMATSAAALQKPDATAAPQEAAPEKPTFVLPHSPSILLPSPFPDVVFNPALKAISEGDIRHAENVEIYWHQVYTGDPACVPSAIRNAAGANEPGLTPEEREYRICTAVNRSWYADHKNMPREKVLAEWPGLRRGLADELGVADDEREIYMALSARHDWQKLHTASVEIYERSYKAALYGEPAPPLHDILAPLSPEYQEAAKTVAAHADTEARMWRERHSGLIDELANGMVFFTAIEDDFISAGDALGASPALLSAVDTLADMPAEERSLIIALAVHESKKRRSENMGDDDESISSRVVRGLRRGSASLGMGALQSLSNLGISAMNNLGKQLGISSMQNAAAAWDKRMRVLREVRHATQQQVIPLITPHSTATEIYLLNAVESVPAAIMAGSGVPGFATLTVAGAGDSIAEARLRSPETPQEYHLAAGVISGAVQASIFMGISRVGGNLLEKNINNFMRARGQGMTAFSWAALNSMAGMSAESVKLLLAGKAAQASDLALHELAGQASGKASGIDWQQYGESLTDVETNMREYASLLPFLLIGSGRLALRHFRAPHNILGDGSRLLEWGIAPEKVSQILNERNIALKGEMLREALCGSKVWSGPGFIIEAVKALRLLNSDYFRGFSSPEVVRDFLNLPAEASVIQRKDYGTRSPEEMHNTPDHAKDRYNYKGTRRSERFKNAITLWDEWWTRSHINSHSSRVQTGEWQLIYGADTARYERMSRYLKELNTAGDKVPRRMQPLGIYAPHAEQERRALLQDRVAELQDLSYQFLMNVNPLETMVGKDLSPERMRKDAERTREEFLGNIGKALVNTGLGTPREESLGQLCDWFQGYYLRKKYRENSRGARIDWIRAVPPDYLRKMSEHAPQHEHRAYAAYPELLEAYRIFLGVRANTELLMDLLPMTEDFQTALSRGMSPAQAYSYLAERELGYKAEHLKSFPAEQVAQSLNTTPMPEFTRLNEGRCNDFMQLTGTAIDAQEGDDGKTYYRLRRPNGEVSRWHENVVFAMNDVAANAALTFLPLGKNAGAHWVDMAHSGNVDLTQMPYASDAEFSGYDRLCHQAMQDLTAHWLESAPYLQPGLRTERLRHRFAPNESYGTGLSPVYREEYAAGQPYLSFDAHTTATPVGLATARFYTFWHRQFNADILPAAQAADFLRSLGEPWLQEVQQLPATTDKTAHHDAVANLMARFSLQYFLAKLPKLPVPKSVKEWVGYAAFCPPVETADKMPDFIAMGKKHNGIMRYTNRRVAAALREQIQHVATLRQRYGDAPLPHADIDTLMQRAMGLDTAGNAEQAWCYRYANGEALQVISEPFLLLLRDPLKGWATMQNREQQQLQEYLQPFLQNNPAPNAREGDSPITAALSNLDAVLRQYPQLHFMSPAGRQQERILTLELPEIPLQTEDLLAEPVYAEQGFPYAQRLKEAGEFRDFPLADYPELTTPEALHAMQLQDILRAYPATMPYTAAEGIHWQGQAYGGKTGKAPAGLEQHKPTRPLVGIMRLLREAHELCADKQAEFIDICGVPIPNLSPQELDCADLRNITVYRQILHGLRGRSITHLSRLMPGDLTAPDSRERSPYVTEVRDGIYQGEHNTALQETDAPQAAMIPLQYYVHAMHRKYAERHMQDSFTRSIDHALDSLATAVENDPRFMEHRFSGGISLPEVLMRLFEDSNFGGGVLGKQHLHELAPPALRLLRLAADIISCVAAPRNAQAPQAIKALKRLQNTMQRMQKGKPQREILQRLLMRGTQLLREKIEENKP